MRGPPSVTIHAVRRFGERALGIRGLDPSDGVALGQMRVVHGIDTGFVEKLIASIVQRGVAAGACSVKFGRHRFLLDGNVVVTVLEIPKTKRRRWRVDRGDV